MRGVRTSIAVVAGLGLVAALLYYQRARARHDGPTFAKEIAPLVHAKCAPCHRPGGAGPFSLLTYDEVVEHSPEIRKVTATRFMPPWRPRAGVATYENDRSLEPAQIELLARWIDRGAPIGDARQLPATPVFKDGWQLGAPDLVLELPEAYDLSGEGTDVYRNFVIPIPVDRERYVDGWELRTGSRAIHHAILNVDRLGLARERDAQDPAPGFGGIDVGDVQSADGLYLVWTPGKTPAERSFERAWRVDPKTDLVLQLHMQPTGKPERVRPTIALYFGDRPPSRPRMSLRIGDMPIDIPAGVANWVGRADWTLPTDVDILSLFPHAHYLARSVKTWARLPDGTTKDLLVIDDWDFAWQDLYTFAEPVRLPKGTTLAMEVVYDNSAANPRNPSRPPRRVRNGEGSKDEMGNVTFQVVPTGPNGVALLREKRYRGQLAASDTARNHYNLANALADLGRPEEAIAEQRRALALEPGLVPARFNLSVLYAARGETDLAIAELEKILATKPDFVDAHVNLALALKQRGRSADALVHLAKAVAIDPKSALAQNNLALASYEAKKLPEAEAGFRAALALDPANWLAHYYLGNVLRDRGTTEDAAKEYRIAIGLRPGAREPRDALAGLGLN